MSETVTDRLHEKQGRSIARWTLVSDTGQTLVVFLKRHYRLPVWDGVKAWLMPSRAWSPGMQEWENLSWAESIGLPVPRAVATAEWLGPWFQLSGFLAVEELAGMLPLHEAIPLASERMEPTAFSRWKLGLVKELARLTVELHRRRVFHKDLYLCHFYVHTDSIDNTPTVWQGRVVVIDLHRLQRHPVTRLWWAVKDLAQLLYSSDVPGVTAKDRLRFWKEYRRADWGGVKPTPEWVLPGVRWKWRNYQNQAERRRLRNPGETAD